MSSLLVQPVVLCGGTGSRLWPVSTPQRLKPFLELAGERTLLHATLAQSMNLPVSARQS
jgi:mannose-1-phosphate guanylyltransferase